MSYIIYPSGSNLYGKASLTADPWSSDAVDLVDLGNNLFQGSASQPFIYIGTAGTAASTDTFVGEIGDLYYGTPDGGNVFHAQRLHSWDWGQSTLYDRVRALYHATQLIDKFNFIGSKVESGQRLQFPRQRTLADGTIKAIGVVGIPSDIQEACYLIADKLLSGRDPDADFEALLNKVETFGPVRTEFERARGPQEHLANLIPSPDAWQRIKPYLEIATSFNVNLG